MVNAEQKKAIYSFLTYLQECQRDNLVKDEGSLEIAAPCISSAFDVPLPDTTSDNKELATPYKFIDIFNAGLKALESNKNASTSINEDPKFLEFINLLKQKGYFNGVEEGSAEYQSRYNKAKEKYLARSEKSAQQALSPEQRAKMADELKAEGNTKMGSGQFKEAIECYTKAIELNPDNSIYYNNRAAAYTHTGEYQKAVKDCEKAVALNPKYSKAFSRMGTAYFYMGKYKEAIERGYKKALELEPNNEHFKKDLQAAEEKLAAASQTPNLFGGMPGMPDFSALANMPGMPPMPPGMDMNAMASLMNNPAIIEMAGKMMSQPGFQNILQSMMSGQMPDFSKMTEMMSNLGMPSADENAGAPFGFPPMSEQVMEQIKNDPEIKDNPKFQALIEEIRTGGPQAAMKYISDPEVAALLGKIANKIFSAPFNDGHSSSSNNNEPKKDDDEGSAPVS